MTQPLAEDSGLAEILPFPFLALVGQHEMKLALLLSLINPMVGGVLLIASQVGRFMIASTPAWDSFARWITA